MDEQQSLVKLSQAREALIEARTLEEIVNIRDIAEVARLYVKKAKLGLDAQNEAAEIKIRAERKAGEVLAKMVKQGNPQWSHDATIVTLSDIGLNKSQSSRWQLLGRMEEALFEDFIVTVRERNAELTTANLLKLAKRLERQNETLKMHEAFMEQDSIPVLSAEYDVDSVYLADIDVLHNYLDPCSIDMVFTDPPYHENRVQYYDSLSFISAHVLKPGAYCITYCGKMFLPEVIDSMSENLEYVWTFAVFHPFSQSKINKHSLFENWRPLLVFKKEGPTKVRRWVQDVVRATRDKQYHEWQQDLESPMQYIEAYTNPGDLVLDPFVGGGTTAVACQKLNRHFLAFDIDKKSVQKSLERLAHDA